MKRNWLILLIGAVVVVFGLWSLWLPRWSPAPPNTAPRRSVPSAAAGAVALSPTVTRSAVEVLTRTAAPVQPATLSPAVEGLLREGRKFPRASELERLTPVEQATLIEAYRRIPSITNKLGIAWALAYAGDAQVGELLWWSLTQEYAGRVFEHPSEPAQLSVLVKFLGLVAEKDDVIYRRLEQGLDPAFWRTNVTWSGPPRMADRTEVLSRNAIEALVLSGRTEGWQTILNLASNPPPWFESAHASSVVQSAYDHAMIALHGKEWFWENCPGDINRLANWMMSDQGRPWREWQMRMERGKSR